MSEHDSLFAAYEPGRSRRVAAPVTQDVRPARVEDAAALARIAQARDGGDVSDHVRAFRKQIRDDGSRWHVVAAVVDDAIAGFGRTNLFVPPEDASDDVAPEGWYLAGVVVDPAHRRLGLGRALTERRLAWLTARTDTAYYFVNAQNRVSLDLHEQLGFVEVTRDFSFPGYTFTGGVGILFRIDLRSRR